MTSTTVTTGHQGTPRIAALTVGVALVVGGAIGVALEQDNSAPDATQAHPYQHSYSRWLYGIAPTTPEDLSGSTPGSSRATTTDEFSGTTHPYPRTWSTSGGSPDGYAPSQECRGCRR
jgi:hypothetical protein